MNKVLMIHEIREWMFDLPLHEYTLTFDDGLYSQYHYWPRIRDINTKKLFFISSNIYCRNGQQNLEFPTCQRAHEKARMGKYEDYMTIDQIRELAKDKDVTIGGHGHSHKDLKTLRGLADCIQHIERDTTYMMQWFKFNLGFAPVAFCFPYNNDHYGMYRALLSRSFGITEFYGDERIPIETLQHTLTQPVDHGNVPMLS